MSTKHLAQGLAGLGRNGDSVLVHMHPSEVSGLQALAEAQGTSLTVNPHTGMPEAFNLMNAFTSFLPTLVGAALAPSTGGASLGLTGGMATAAPIIGGALTGAALAGAKGDDPLMGGLMGGFGGYGGGNLGTSLAKLGGGTAAQTAADTNLNIAQAAKQMGGPGVRLAAAPGGYDSLTATTQPALQNLPQVAGTPAPTGMDNLFSGAKELAGLGDQSMESAWKNYTSPQVGGSAAQIGMPLGMAALAGVEPSDLYGDLGKYSEDKYDPRARLDLSGDSGLRLLAEGGLTSGGLSSIYSNPDGTMAQNTLNEGYGAARLDNLAKMYNPGFARGGYLDGPGDGMSDSIPATIAGRQPARLADGEFVVPADVVSHLGNGSTKAGAKQLYKMMDKVREARTGTKKQGREINPHKYMPV